MKKLLTILLLLVFCTNPIVFAEEIVNSVENNENITVGSSKMSVEKQEVKNVVIKPINYNDKTFIKYQKKFSKYVEKAPNILDSSDKVLNKYGYFASKSDILSLAERIEKNEVDDFKKFDLQDGDFALWDIELRYQKTPQYAAEYHKDGSLMGIVKIENVKTSWTSGAVTTVFYEYRTNEKNSTMQLKHIMIMDATASIGGELSGTIVQFIYKDKEVVCYEISTSSSTGDDNKTNTDVYVSNELKNLLIKDKLPIHSTMDIDLEGPVGKVLLPAAVIAGSPLFLAAGAVYAVVAAPVFLFLGAMFTDHGIKEYVNQKMEKENK